MSINIVRLLGLASVTTVTLLILSFLPKTISSSSPFVDFQNWIALNLFEYYSWAGLLVGSKINQLAEIIMKDHKDAINQLDDSISWLWRFCWQNTKWKTTLLKEIPYGDSIFAAAAALALVGGVRKGWHRFRTATDIPASLIRQSCQLRGRVVAVNDSDNVRFYHEPLLYRWLLPRRSYSYIRGANSRNNNSSNSNNKDPGRKEKRSEETINVRLAGIDAPELGHFGGQSQPGAEAAREWLTKFTLGRAALIIVHRIDQYGRAVASVKVQRKHWWSLGLWQSWSDVSLSMVQAGWATVYEGAGAEYGEEGMEEKLRKAQEQAKGRGRGIWHKWSAENYISPAEYKRQRMLKIISSK